MLNASIIKEFPSVWLCPPFWVDVEKALSLGLSLDGVKYSLGYTKNWQSDLRNLAKPKLNFFDFYYSHNFSSLNDYYKNISIDIPTVYSFEQFNELEMAVKIDANSTLTGRYFNGFNLCNAYSLQPTNLISPHIRLISTKFYDKMSEIATNLPSGLWFYTALDLNSLYPEYEYSPMFLPTNTRSSVLISEQKFITLNKKDAGCIDQEVDKDYTSSSCFAVCTNEMYKKKGKCQLWYSAVNQSASLADYCNNLETSLIQLNQTDANDEITNYCITRCPRKCDRTTYSLSLQWQQPIKSVYNGSRNNEITVEIWVSHMAVYEKGTLVFAEVNTYSFVDLMNNVGGTLGLFVGATLLTFAQAFLFLVERLLDRSNQVMQN